MLSHSRLFQSIWHRGKVQGASTAVHGLALWQALGVSSKIRCSSTSAMRKTSSTLCMALCHPSESLRHFCLSLFSLMIRHKSLWYYGAGFGIPWSVSLIVKPSRMTFYSIFLSLYLHSLWFFYAAGYAHVQNPYWNSWKLLSIWASCGQMLSS